MWLNGYGDIVLILSIFEGSLAELCFFLMLSTSIFTDVSQNCVDFDVKKIEEISQNSFAFDVVKFHNWGSLAE